MPAPSSTTKAAINPRRSNAKSPTQSGGVRKDSPKGQTAKPTSRTNDWKTFGRSLAVGFEIKEPADPLTWCPDRIRFPITWERKEFDFNECPHVRGILTRFYQEPRLRKANLIWATRLAKSSTVISLIGYLADEAPAPMGLLLPDEGTQKRTVNSQLYPILLRSGFGPQLPPKHLRNMDEVLFERCSLRIANGGSKSSVSGWPAKYIFKMENDKNNTDSRTESDPSLRIESRTTGYDEGVKILEESTPADESVSRGTKLLKSKNAIQARFQVQCPHCKTFQVLDFYKGVKWSRLEDGSSTPGLTERSAYYQCQAKTCGQKIENHHRYVMMNTGVWVFAGERVTKRGKIVGKWKVDTDVAVFGPLSKLYSLLIAGWGVVAREYVEAKDEQAKGNEEPLRTFQTETLAIAWNPKPKVSKPDIIAKLLISSDETRRGFCPPWTKFTTFAADVGGVGNVLFFYWMACAWGKGARGHVIDWGLMEGEHTFKLATAEQRFAIQGQPDKIFRPVRWLVDSSDFTHSVYRITGPITDCYPLKGDSGLRGPAMYKLGFKGGDTAKALKRKRKAGIGDLIEPNSHLTQTWRQSLVSGVTERDGEEFVSLPFDVCRNFDQHVDFFRHLTSDYRDGNRWLKNGANEYGDTLRYNRVAAEMFCGGMWEAPPFTPHEIWTPPSVQHIEEQDAGFVRSSDGPFVRG